MSSPVPSSHELDTPVSQGSPVNLCSSPKSSIPTLITPSKEEDATNADTLSPKINGDTPSGNSSPASSSESPLQLSSPANGILTPPTETDGNDCGKSDKSAGRLKFYKDGILCLELSHHNEGERTKWVQIRTKTVFPTVVHATKEATIPCHISPSSFSGPSSVPLQSRVESSTSHSMSDDGSSMLSSPRPREGTWKQPVPQKAISSCLEFFMNPAVCVFNLRSVVKKNSKSQVLKTLSRQLDRVNRISVPEIVSQCDSNSLLCSCNRLHSSSNEKHEVDCVDSGENLRDDSGTKSVAIIKSEPSSIVSRTKKKYLINRKMGVTAVCDRLRDAGESKLLEDASKCTSASNCSDESKVSSAKTQAILPKKRIFKEMDSKDLRPPKKKSPTSHKIVHDAKTILNVPGLNSEFYRRHSSQLVDPSGSGLDGQKAPTTGNFPYNAGEDKLKGHGNPVSRKGYKPSRNAPHHAKLKTELSSNNSNITTGAKSSPTRGNLKKISELDFDPKFLNNQIPYSMHSAMSLSSLPLQQQEKFLQQQTMSKAISYTINSLLSNSTPTETSGSSKNSLLKPNLDAVNPYAYSEKSLGQNSANGSSNRSSKSKSIPLTNQLNNDLPQGNRGLKPDQDQNSFLRHLLDTSDPIPSTMEKSERSNGAGGSERGKQASWSPNSRNSHSKKSNSSDSRPSSGGEEIKKNSSPSSKPVSHSNKSASGKSSSGHHFAPYPSQFHSSLVSGGFPLRFSAYDALLRGQQDPQSALAAAAAAAAFQYQSLLPQNVVNNFNSQMAAAMAASYLGGAPSSSHSISALSSSRSPDHPHSSSPINYSSSSPLNLSQRARSGLPNGLHSEPGVIPGPFHASPGDTRHSGRGSPSSTAYSRNRLDNLHEPDSDTPLNLSKKPRST